MRLAKNKVFCEAVVRDCNVNVNLKSAVRVASQVKPLIKPVLQDFRDGSPRIHNDSICCSLGYVTIIRGYNRFESG